MSRKQILTDEQVRDMREAMAGGESIQACADRLKLPYFTVYQIRRGWTYSKIGGPAIERSRGHMTPAKAERIRHLRAKGATIDQLAKAASVGRTTVKKVLAAS